MGTFSELLHPRGARGRFAVSLTGRSRRDPAAKEMAPLGKRAWRSLAQLNVSQYRTRREKRVTSMKKWEPGVATVDGGMRDARVAYRYFKGRLGPSEPHPRGGTHRPLLEVAGWKQTGFQVMSAGYTRKRLAQTKESRAALRARLRARWGN